MSTISDALERLYESAPAHERVVTMRQFLEAHPDNRAAAGLLAGTGDKGSRSYKAAIRNVQRYRAAMTGGASERRNPDAVRISTLRRATQAEARQYAKRRGIHVSSYKGKVQTSPPRKRRATGSSLRDDERERTISNVTIPGRLIDGDVLDGDTKAFSDAFLTAYGAGAIGELYDIDELELEYGGGDYDEDEAELDDDEFDF